MSSIKNTPVEEKTSGPTIENDENKPASNTDAVASTESNVEPEKQTKPVKPPKPIGSKPSIVIGDTTVVPAFSMAKLMYYLRCIKTCVDLEIGSRLIDYMNHQLLTELERRDVVVFAHRYRPGVLRNVVLFEVDDHSPLLPRSANTFLAVDDPMVAEHFTPASNDISVDGVEYPIKKLLIFKYSWLHDYFSVPFSEENWRIGLSPKPVSAILSL